MVLSNNHKNKNKLISLKITRLINDKREEEKVNVYEIRFQSIDRETNSKEIALSLFFFILMLTAYKREEIT